MNTGDADVFIGRLNGLYVTLAISPESTARLLGFDIFDRQVACRAFIEVADNSNLSRRMQGRHSVAVERQHVAFVPVAADVVRSYLRLWSRRLSGIPGAIGIWQGPCK